MTSESSPSAILHRLVGWGLVDAVDAVDGELTMRVAAGRNGALIVECEGVPGVIVKQAAGPAGREGIEREASAYEALAAHRALRRLAPRLLRYDPATATLVIELVPSAEGSGEDPSAALLRPGVAAWLGGAIGALHASTEVERRHGPQPEGAPWLARLDEPPLQVACQLGPPAARIARMVQQAPALSRGLSALRSDWTPACVCHMDLRPDNVIVAAGDEGSDPRLVDWESAGLGDPAWDLGWALGSCLSLWIDSMPTGAPVPAVELVGRAKRPLEEVRAAAGIIWHAYLEARSAPGPSRAHVARCAAARLLAAATEEAGDDDGLGSAGVLHVQLAASMMERPEAAARDLLAAP